MQPTITEQQAGEKAEKHVNEVVALLQPSPRLEVQSSLTQECDPPSDGGPLGRVTVSVRYWLRDIPTSAHPAVFAAVEDHWSTPRWRVLEDRSKREQAPTIWVENAQDSFRMRLSATIDGSALTLSAVSPCVWPNGTPEPESR